MMNQLGLTTVKSVLLSKPILNSLNASTDLKLMKQHFIPTHFTVPYRKCHTYFARISSDRRPTSLMASNRETSTREFAMGTIEETRHSCSQSGKKGGIFFTPLTTTIGDENTHLQGEPNVFGVLCHYFGTV